MSSSNSQRIRMAITPASNASKVQQLESGGCMATGFCSIEARPHRSPGDARQLAIRVASCPRQYLGFVLQMPGVKDLRPTFGKLKPADQGGVGHAANQV